MVLPRMGKPPFLKPHHLQDNELVEIIEKPYVQSEEESRFGRQRGYAVIKVLRTGETYTWPLNGTTWDRLLDAWGNDEALWKAKKAKLKLENMTVRGETKQVIYGMPYQEPQKSLAAA